MLHIPVICFVISISQFILISNGIPVLETIGRFICDVNTIKPYYVAKPYNINNIIYIIKY